MFGKGGLLRSFRSSNSSNSSSSSLTPSDNPTGIMPFMVDEATRPPPRRSYATASGVEEDYGRDDTISIAESSSSRGAPSFMSISSGGRRESLPPTYAELDSLTSPRPRPLSSFTQASSSSSGSSSTSSQDPDDATEQRRRRTRRRQGDMFGGLQSISEANASSSNLSVHSSAASVHSSFTPSLFGINSSYARRMEETGRLRRLQSQQQEALAPNDTKRPRTPEPDPPSPSSSVAGPSRPRQRPESELLPPYVSPTDITFDVVSPTADPEPEPEPEPQIPPPDTPIPEAEETPPDDQTDPQTRLTQVLRELEEARTSARQLAAEREEEKAALLSRVETSERCADELNRELATQTRLLSETRSELNQTRASLSALMQEKRGWQDKFDVMHHKVQRAERQIRCLDHITRAKLEARQTTHAIRRTKQIMSMELAPSMEVIRAVEVLNEEILQLANLFVENIERTRILSNDDNTQRAKAVLGEGMTAMMETQVNDQQDGFSLLLMQVALEVFMTSWCSAIIDGYYPKQESFTDLLLEMSSQSLVNASRKGHVPLIACGNPIQVIQVHAAASMAQKFPEWVAEIIDDLATILLVGGLKMRSQRSSMFTSKFNGLVRLAYDLRAALAEKDLAGGLDLYMVAPDTPFQAKWMDEGHEAQTQVSELDVEPIAGTSGLGLARDASHGQQYYYNGTSRGTRPTMVLKPKVVLLRVLQENP